MFDFHHIYVFVNVVQHKSFSKAAEAIYLSQSTVSTHIQNLEKELKTNLFDRIGKNVVLTPAGEKFYIWARELLAIREKAIMDLNRHFSKIEGTIKIAASTVPAQYIVPSLIGRFQVKYPDVFFRVFQENSASVVEKVLSGEMEIGFTGTKFEECKLKYYSLMTDKLIVITPPSIDFGSEFIEPEELFAQKLIMRNKGSGTQRVLENALKNEKYSFSKAKIIATFSSTEAVMQAVKSGLGVAVVSARAAEDYIQSGYVNSYEIKGLDLRRDFYLIVHAERTLAPICEEFIKFVESEKDNLKERSISLAENLC